MSCCCCGNEFPARAEIDPWDGRMDAYCNECSIARCDAYPGECPNKTRYATIVADPPWHYGKRGGFSWREGAPSGETEDFLDYPTMTLDEIAALPVDALAAPDAHLLVWTTQRYLVWTQAQVAAWGFDYRKLLVWAKPPTGFSLGGAFGNSCEFVVYATRGKPQTTGKVSRDWWEWSRRGHSVKPEAFLDVVEAVCPGPYLEMFARRNRLGWDTWGNESLEHVKLAA